MWHLIERLANFANQTEHEIKGAWLIELRQRLDQVLTHNSRLSRRHDRS
jgi:hypothetical protein